MTTLTETVLFWRGYWPAPFCSRDKLEHAFDRYLNDFVCAFCGARVMPEDVQALEVWWQNFHRHSLVYDRN